MNFEELFAQYPCPFTDEQVQAQVADIEAKHFAENNNVEVWKECLHQIDYTTLSADERQIGGLGIFLIRELMDTINYERRDGKNILTMEKRVKS